jgi:hypothetical protein
MRMVIPHSWFLESENAIHELWLASDSVVAIR